MKLVWTCLTFAALTCSAAHAYAQVAQAPDLSQFHVKLGPVYLNPELALTNAGVDTNVFNVPDTQSPQKDFTATVEPKTAIWLPFGRTWINSNITEDIVWFKKFSSERYVSSIYNVNWLIPLSRISLQLGAERVQTRDRPGFEIDTRARQHENDVNGAFEVLALSRTYFGAKVDRRTTDFDQDQIFLGTDLQDLSRTATVAALTIRNQLTPLTNLTLNVAREQDRFEFDHLRDSNSNEFNAGLKFDPVALIKGSMMFGYRDFRPVIGDIAGYKGFTAAVDVTYVPLESTKLALTVNRDVQYSYDIEQPYYVQSGFTASMTQQVFGPVDVQGRGGAARLSYETRTTAVVADPDRVDHTRTYGGGLGYHFGPAVRLGFNLDQVKRLSVVDDRNYHGLRYGTSITYDF